MQIQLIAIRPTPAGSKKPFYDRFTRPEVTAPSLKALFESPEKYLEKLPKEERWNVFYTVALCKNGQKRAFVRQDVLAFDGDGIDTSRILDYLPVIAKTLHLREESLTAVSSGHGIHVLIQLSTPIDTITKPLQAQYKRLCEMLAEACAEASLPLGKWDMILDKSRILRCPGTENRKKGQEPVPCRLLQTCFEPQDLNLAELTGISPEDYAPAGGSTERGAPVQVLSPSDDETILSECGFLKWTRESPEQVREPDGYYALSILSRLGNDPSGTAGRLLAKSYLKNWTKSTSIASWDPDTKIDQALEMAGPAHCSTIALKSNSNACQTCPHFGKIKSPINLKGPGFIPTEGTGFHRTIVQSGKVKLVPDVRDLRAYFEKLTPYRVVTSDLLYRWDDSKKHYVEMGELELPAFAETHFDPKPLTTTVSEFVSVFTRYNVVTSEWFGESTEGKVNFQNGVLDWTTQTLAPHTPALGFRYVLPFHYTPGGEAPRWEQFLDEIFASDLERAQLAEEYIGYALSGDPMWMHKALLLSGTGSNGKSTFIKVMQELAGKGNFSAVKIDKFNDERFVQMLDGKLFNISGETPRRGFEDTAGLKELVGGDRITARRIYGSPYTFQNRAKIIFACNEIPQTRDHTDGFYRRFWILDFKRNFSQEKGTADMHLDEKLRAELPGIFDRCMRAYLRAKESGAFTEPQASRDAIRALKVQMDVVGNWLDEALIKDPRGRVTNPDLWTAFAGWMESTGNGRELSYWNVQKLAHRLNRQYADLKPFRTRNLRGWEGVRLVGGTASGVPSL